MKSNTDEMTPLERVVFTLERMRVAGGWDDEAAARQVMAALHLDEHGKPMRHEGAAPPAPQPGGK